MPGLRNAGKAQASLAFLNKKNKIKNPEFSLLDIAPDQALQTKFKSFKNINYVSVDLNSVLAMQKMDLTNLTFERETFNAVLCYHVLEHIEDDKKAISEIYSVMKKNAWAILQSPVDLNRKTTYEDSNIRLEEERLKAFGQKDHVRIYGKDYTSRLRRTGFKVEENNYIKGFSSEAIKKYGLDENEIIYFCTKEE